MSHISHMEFIDYTFVNQESNMSTVLNAFHDPKIGSALALIHNQPSENWTVEKLASAVAMSRSRFADRFSSLLGTGPMSYLTDWRLQKALSLLEQPGYNMQQIAAKIGYRSPAAFTRAFSGKFGISPSEHKTQSNTM